MFAAQRGLLFDETFSDEAHVAVDKALKYVLVESVPENLRPAM